MKSLEIIKNFVENGFDEKALQDALYHNRDLIEYLESVKGVPKYSDQPSAYHEILSENFSDFGSRLNIYHIFLEILNLNEVKYIENQSFQYDYDFISRSVPKWIPHEKHFIQELYEKNKNISKNDFKDLVLKSFQILSKKPKWLQSPDWIIKKEPLIFVQQIDVSHLYHDTSYLYLFFDPNENNFEYIIQSA